MWLHRYHAKSTPKGQYLAELHTDPETGGHIVIHGNKEIRVQNGAVAWRLYKGIIKAEEG